MRSTFVTAVAAFLSLASFAQAIPQQGGGGGESGYGGSSSTYAYASSSVASSATSLSAATSVSLAAAATGTTACNNSPDLCNRNYNNITHLGAHDSAFLRDASTSYSTAGNQFYNVSIALSAGVRLLQAQVHNSNGTLELCHTSCVLLDAGSLVDWLDEIKTWMDSNANEVVTILLVNSDDEDVSKYGAVFESSGISKYGYTPTSTTGPISTWPTLQTLIDADTRLITFIASITYSSTYPYLLDEFDYIFETAYDVVFPDGFNCTLDRPSSVSSASAALSSGYMPFMNHMADTFESFGITVPDITDIKTTNSPETNTTGALGTTAASCSTQWGIKPTYILVDFFNVGPAIDTADTMNGITAEGRTDVSTALLSKSNSTSTSSSSGASTSLLGMSWSMLAGMGLATVAVMNAVWL